SSASPLRFLPPESSANSPYTAMPHRSAGEGGDSKVSKRSSQAAGASASTITAVALVEVPATRSHYVKVQYVTPEGKRVGLVPLSKAEENKSLGRYLADRLGVPGEHCPSSAELLRDREKLPKVVGVARLGWTDDHAAFLYGGEVIPVKVGATR